MPGSAWLLAVAAWAGPVGPTAWRHDGTGIVSVALPADWSEDGVRWRTRLPSWGNASPVVVDGWICVTGEPTRLTCLDEQTGAERWTASHPVVDALEPDEAARVRPALEALEAELEQVVPLRQRLSSLSREARRGDAAAEAAVAEVSETLLRLTAAEREYEDYRTPPTREQIGYATSTPATDGARLFALFGNGVVAARALDGEALWRRWLGPQRTRIHGFGVGHGASPVLAGGVLVVPWERLHGLDPDTGETLWEGPEHADYGTPAVVTAGGAAYVVSPAGPVVRVADGVVVGDTGHGVYWTSPVPVDGGAVVVGGVGEAHGGSIDNRARRVAIGPKGEVSTVWTTSLDGGQRYYASPVVAHGRVFAVDDGGAVVALDAASGAVVARRAVEGSNGFLPSLVVADDRLIVATEGGHVSVLDVAGDLPVVATHRVEGGRSTLAPRPGAVVLRTLSGVVVFGSR